jgi:hypothetical protein
MSKTSPGDVAVAFRSLARREREALDAGAAAAATGLSSELRRIVAEAGTLVGRPAAGGPSDVAEAIEATPGAEWEQGVVDQLGELALAAGAALRRATEAADAGGDHRSDATTDHDTDRWTDV